MNAKLRRLWMDIAGWDNLDAWKIIEKESHNEI